MCPNSDSAAPDGASCLVVAPPEIDPATRSQFQADLLAARRDAATVIVDMTKTTFCDSSGISLLVEASRKARAADGDVVLAGVGMQVARILTVIGADRLFVTCDSVEDALQCPPLSAHRTGPSPST